MKIEELLHKEIVSELEELNKIDVGGEKYKEAVDGVSKLMDKAIEIERLNVEYEEKVKARETETELKQQQLDDERKDKKIRNILAGMGIAVPAGLTVWGTIKSINFEKEGTITTIAGRNFINKAIMMFKK